jgi:hypothetical protein
MALRHMLRAMLVAAVFIGTACGPAMAVRSERRTAVEEGAGSLAEARKYLGGRWALESFEVHPPGRPPVALKTSGNLVYDEFGNMRMDIRVDPSLSDRLREAGVEIKDGAISSDGRTVVDLQNRTLTYVVVGQPPPSAGPLALGRPRHWQVEGDVLTLITKDDAGNPVSVARWKKAQ